MSEDRAQTYGEIAVCKIAHSQKLAKQMPEQDLDLTVPVGAALTIALMGLLAEESFIAQRLGKLGRKKSRPDTSLITRAAVRPGSRSKPRRGETKQLPAPDTTRPLACGWLIALLRVDIPERTSTMAKRPITPAELQGHLDEQLEFLERSAASFDAGYEGEAKELAVSLRVLLHDTQQSHSLLGQLGRREGTFVDTALHSSGYRDQLRAVQQIRPVAVRRPACGRGPLHRVARDRDVPAHRYRRGSPGPVVCGCEVGRLLGPRNRVTGPICR